MTCAMWITNSHGRPKVPDGRLVSVKNVDTGITIQVAWTDNGPHPSTGNLIDLTPAAFSKIAILEQGKIMVMVERAK